MKLGEILKTAGSVALRNAVPGGAAIVEMVNAFLPDNKKLPGTATGDEVKTRISDLPQEDRLSLLEKELDVEIAQIQSWASIQDSLARADQAGSSTRPKIALMMAWVVVFAVVLVTSIWSVAIYSGDSAVLATLSESWPLTLSILATPTALLRAYFGMRTLEKTARYAAATGQQKKGIISEMIESIKR